jgi:hypothetical protein
VRDLASLTAADFEAAVGSRFAIATGEPGAWLTVRLTEVVQLKEWPGHRWPFLVHFEGPLSPVLAHVVHHVSHPELGELDIFLGPVLSGTGGITYEAVFA